MKNKKKEVKTSVIDPIILLLIQEGVTEKEAEKAKKVAIQDILKELGDTSESE